MEDVKKRRQIPAFGHWEYCDDIPISQYFDFAWQGGLMHRHSAAEDEEDLFEITAAAKILAQHHNKVKKSGGEKKQGNETPKKQVRVYDENTQKTKRAPMAVDEDLYKIPPELLYQKPKRKKMLKNLWWGCMRLSCVH